LSVFEKVAKNKKKVVRFFGGQLRAEPYAFCPPHFQKRSEAPDTVLFKILLNIQIITIKYSNNFYLIFIFIVIS